MSEQLEKEMQDKIAIMHKSVSDITPEEMESVMIPIGVPGMPYPTTEIKENSHGLLEKEVKVLEETDDVLAIYSYLPIERVWGDLYRQMMTPSMMTLFRDLVLCTNPESNKFLMTIFGEASSGKTHLFRMIGQLVHPEGAIHIDCGGMNLRELFFRTVIDYGKGVKDQIDKKVANGAMFESSMRDIETAFPGAVIEKDGKKALNWDVIGTPKRGEDGKLEEEYGTATARAAAMWDTIFMREGIDKKTNSFGIVTVPGELIEAYNSGRPIILDEFNKSKLGTDDTFQVFLEFANGQKFNDSVTINNPMATSDDTSMKSIRLHRKDRKMGFFIGVSGNDKSDGATTHELSYSMKTRLQIKYLDEPTLDDWKHRVSQLMTGLSTWTLHELRKDDAEKKSADFAKWLVDLRLSGLSATEMKAVPPEEIGWLQNYGKLLKASNAIAELMFLQQQLSKPSSKIYEKEGDTYGKCEDEAARYGDRIAVSFRTVIDLLESSKRMIPVARDKAKATWSDDLKSTFDKVKKMKFGKSGALEENIGTNLMRNILEDIANRLTKLPNTMGAVLTYCKTKGICDPNHQEALPSGIESLAKLLNADDYEKWGGAPALKKVRSVVTGYLRAVYDNLAGTDEQVVPLRKLGPALMLLNEEVKERNEKIEELTKALETAKKKDEKAIGEELENLSLKAEVEYIMPNTDLEEVSEAPLIRGYAMSTYDINLETSADDQATYELVDFRAALAGLATPGFAQKNLENTFPLHLDEYSDNKPTDKTKKCFDILQGKSDVGLDLTVLKVKDEKGEQTFMYLLRDRIVGESLLICEDDVSGDLKSQLSKNSITFVWNRDPETCYLEKEFKDPTTNEVKEQKVEALVSAKSINDFLSRGAQERALKHGMNINMAQEAVSNIMKAFSMVNPLPKDDKGNQTVEEQTTLGEVLSKSRPKPSIFTSIVKKR